MSDEDLQQIQALQFTDVEAANALMIRFLNKNLPFKVTEVKIRPLAVSLNSLNGFLTREDGQKLFFKTHVEPKSIINEYYNSTILAEAGYPVIQPIFSSTEWGKQLLIYECVDQPSLFDIIRSLELGDKQNAAPIIAIQQRADDNLWEIYRETLQYLRAEEHEKAPIHQLFVHRLTGGRLTSFYKNTDMILPGHKINFASLAEMKWIINGVEFQDTLGSLVQQAIELLEPSRYDTPSIIGHGDAHNGNVFVDDVHTSLIYFDPAFAGRHSPLLDLAKPLFHNVFAIWMYFPKEIARVLSIDLEIQGNTIVVKHDFVPSEVRLALLHSKIHRVLSPLLSELKSRTWLPSQWRKYLKLALFCCPFLTMNLSDSQRFPPEITLLGLAMSVEMGSDILGNQKSLLDYELDAVVNI